MKTTFAALFLCAGLAAAQEGAAPEDPAEESFGEVIVVTATRDERALDELPVSVTVVDRQEIETAPASTTDELFRDVAGVNLPLSNSTVNHPMSNFVSMRGLGGARALVLVDGQPLNDSFFGFVPWDRSPLDDVDRVEVVRGGSSSLFGSYALGGVINILTRPVEGTSLRARVLGGSNGTYRANLYGSQKAGDRLGLSASLDAFGTDGYIALEPSARGPIDSPSRSESRNARLKAEYQASDSLLWFGRVGAFDQEGSFGTRLSRTSREAIDLAAGSRWSTGDGGLDVTVFFQDQDLTTDNVDVPFGSGRTAEYVSNAHETPVEDLGASAVWSRRLSSLLRSVVAGVDLRRIEGEDRARLFDKAGRLQATQTSGGTQSLAGAFVETGFSPASNVEVLLSARFDSWRNTDGEEAARPGGTVRFPDKSAREVSPRLAVRWQAAPFLGLRAAAYRAFRAPNLDELYRSSSTAGSELVANPRLDPEILTGAEAGFDLLLGSFRGQVNVFRNDVEDQITFVATRFFPVFTLEVQNVGESRAQGVEAIAEADLGAGFSLAGSYTWTDTEVLSHPPNRALEGKRRVGVPEDQAALTLRYVDPGLGWTAAARARSSSERFTDLQNTRALDSHQVLDLSASLPLGRGFELFAIAENVLGEEYAVSGFGGRILGAPRQTFLGVRYEWR